MQGALQAGQPPSTFRYRGINPAIADRALTVNGGAGGEAGRFWTQSEDGIIHMEACTDRDPAR